MILPIFIMLLALSLVFLFYGFYSNIDLYKIMASIFLFILGTMILPGVNAITDSLEYKVGENVSIAYIYGDNYTGYHWDYEDCGNYTVCEQACPEINLFHTVEVTTNIYNTYENHLLGFFLTITGIFSLVVTMVDRRHDK